MLRLIPAVLLALSATSRACWVGLDPVGYSGECPVVISGTIERIDEGAAADRSYDLARIRVAVVHKNRLKDVDAGAGKLVLARMSGVRSRMSASTDLRYPVGAKATWLIRIDADGELSICQHPCQFQPPDKAGRWWGETRFRAELELADSTIAQWLERQRRAEVEARNAREQQSRLREETDALIRNWVGERTDEVLQRILAMPVEARRSIAQTRADSTFTPEQLAALFVELLEHDPDSNVRAHAATSLGREEHIKQGTPALLKALNDSSAEVRLFACQALWGASAAQAVPAVEKLLADKERDVRLTAIRTLGRLGERAALEPIMARYRSDYTGKEEDWVYADALTRLGEEEVSLKLIAHFMESDNWNVRYFMTLALEQVKSDRAIPVAVSLLAGALDGAIRDMKGPRVDDRVYEAIWRQLEQRTGQKFGDDLVAWHDWWKQNLARVGGAPPELDGPAAKARLEEYRRLRVRD